jgi:hypothetical protein
VNIGAQTHVLWLIILVNRDVRLAAALGDLDGCDFGGEPASLCGSDCLLVRADAVFILVLAAEAMVVGALLTLETHVLLLVGIRQTILEYTIDKRLISELGASPQDREVVRSIRHALRASGDNNIRISSHDGLCANNERLDGGRADLVDGGSNSRFGKTSTDCALAGRVLAKAVALISANSKVRRRLSYFAERTLPTKTSWTSSGFKPERSTAAA